MILSQRLMRSTNSRSLIDLMGDIGLTVMSLYCAFLVMGLGPDRGFVSVGYAVPVFLNWRERVM